MSDSQTQQSEGLAGLFRLDETRTPAIVVIDTDAVDRFVSALGAVVGQLGVVAAAMQATAEAVQAQVVALHAMADAIAAPVEDEPEVDNRPRYLDGTPMDV